MFWVCSIILLEELWTFSSFLIDSTSVNQLKRPGRNIRVEIQLGQDVEEVMDGANSGQEGLAVPDYPDKYKPWSKNSVLFFFSFLCSVPVLFLFCFCSVFFLFCFRSVSVSFFCSVSVLFLFCFCSVFVLFCFCTVSVLFLSCFCSVSVLFLFCFWFQFCAYLSCSILRFLQLYTGFEEKKSD